ATPIRSIQKDIPPSNLISPILKKEQISINNTYAACPRDWIGFGSKCFYFSENTNNWTFSQTFCMEREAQLARFDSLEELVRKDRELVCCLFC
uniref:Uncharacterized protein n=1 Tax=Peromyscus maniculatus bairdii TaxID=230844 RepID=A0A8C8U657_PERMB